MTGLINPRLDQIQSMHDMNIESIRHFLMKILQHIEWREMSHKMLLEMQVIQSIGYNIHIQISYLFRYMAGQKRVLSKMLFPKSLFRVHKLFLP